MEEELLNQVVQVFMLNGVVTRNDIDSMDSRSVSRKLFDGLLELGYENAQAMEVQKNNYHDYSTVIYNTSEYSSEDARKYMLKNVLHDYIEF